MMKRLVALLFFFFLVVLGVALVAPGFIDWNRHKDRIAAAIEPYVARKVDLAGNVSFRIIPQPRLLLENVTVSNPEGAKTDFLLRLKAVEARVRFMPLLQGRVEVEAVNLVGPQLNLEVMEDGRANWTSILKEREEGRKIGLRAAAIQLDKVTVTGGALRYINSGTESERQVDDLNLAIAAASLFGPYRIGGDMKYGDAPVGIDITTGAYSGAGPVELKVVLTPAGGLPRVRLDGTLALGGGLDAQGHLSVENGALAGFAGDFMGQAAFMAQPVTLDADLEFKGSEAKLGNIKAKFGEGTLSGRATALFARGQKPTLSLELEGVNLSLSEAPRFFDVPSAFNLALKAKGKNIVFQGVKLPSVEFAADADQKDWIVKQLRVMLPGNSDIRVAGIITPKTKYAALSVQLETEDLAKMLAAASLADNSALKILAEQAAVKKLKFSAETDFKPNNISFSSINALAGGKAKVSGSLDVARLTTRPAYAARLTLDGWDGAAFTDEAFLKKLMQADGDFSLTFANLAQGGMQVREMKVSGRVDDKGLFLKDVVATVSENEGFDFNGHAAGLAPLRGFDFDYTVKMADGAALAKAFGLPLPPPLREWKNLSLRGKVAGDPAKYTFTADGKVNGGEAGLNGAFEQGAYKLSLRLRKPAGGEVMSMMGLPVEKLLVAQSGAFDFYGELAGTAEDFEIGNIRSQLGESALSGVIRRKGGKTAAELSVDRIDFDNWLWNDWAVKDPVALSLSGKTLVWRDMVVENPVLAMEAGPAEIRISKVTGKLWGGDVDASVVAEKKDGSWSGTLKGSLKSGDLDQLRELLEMKGLSLGRGDLAFDLVSTGAKFLDFTTLSGKLDVRSDKLSIGGFNPAGISPVLAQIRVSPGNLQQLVNNALKEKGEGVYAHVAIPLVISGGKASFKDVKLSGENHTVMAEAVLELSPYTYDLKAVVQPKAPEGVPAIIIQRNDGLKETGDYSVDIRALETWITGRTPPPQPAPPGDAVRGIMERLEE